MRSPVVRMGTSSQAIPAAASDSRTISAWFSASREPRVPRRSVLCGIVIFRLVAAPNVSRGTPLSRKLTILGLETSCDETAASVVRGCPPGPGTILSNIVLSQVEEHAAFGGVVPEIAARAHVEALDAIVEHAIAEAQINPEELDAVAATAGPGLIGGVMVGLTTAKALALAWNKPFVAVNHLEAHALTARLTHGVAFPYLL